MRALWLGIGVLTNKIVHAEKMELKELNKAINICTAMLPHEHNPIARREVTELKTYLLNRRQDVIKLYIDMRSRIAEVAFYWRFLLISLMTCIERGIKH